MEDAWLTIAAVGISAVIAIAFLIRKKEQALQNRSLSPIGVVFVVLGIVFGANDRLVGYSFIGVGVLLSIVNAARRSQKGNKSASNE